MTRPGPPPLKIRRSFGIGEVHPHSEFYTTSKGIPHSSLPSQRGTKKEKRGRLSALIL
jgi:hypothetical protein